MPIRKHYVDSPSRITYNSGHHLYNSRIYAPEAELMQSYASPYRVSGASYYGSNYYPEFQHY